MKRKTIENIISNKIDAWLNSIEDRDFRYYLLNNIIVTGGCIASMFLNEQINDFDIYLRTKESAQRIAEYYVDLVKKDLKEDIEINIEDDRIRIVIPSSGIIKVKKNKNSKKYYPVCLTTHAITLSNRVQVVIRFFGEPEDIHKNYDYIHCTNYWTSWGRRLVTSTSALESLLSKELIYVGSKYPIASILRLRKFIKRGWTINAGQILKMCYQLNYLNLNDAATLEDQLIGVDISYFNELLNKVRADNPETITSAYIINIVEEIFQ